MPAKNKQQKNAFYWYMQELMPQLKREGRVFPNGLADVVPIAHPRFKALEPNELKRFEDMAKEHKKRMRGQAGDDIRQDSAGNIIAQRRDVVTDYETTREKEVVEMASRWPAIDIMEVEFHFIDTMSLTKTIDDEYLPVEIALITFSLKDGIKKTYHQFLRPPPLPTGCRYECMSTSEATHKIPVEGHEDATDNFLSVQNSIENFINPQGRKSQYPPIFAMRENWQEAVFTLNYIKGMSGLGRQAVNIKMYEMESLFLALIKYSGSEPPSKMAAKFTLNGADHDFHPNLACDFHKDDGHTYCCLFKVKRFCYSMAEALEAYFDYELKPGTHLPTTKKINFEVVTDDSWKPRCLNRKVPSDDLPVLFRTPTNLPKTDSVLANPRVGRPAPIFRPPGAADLDFGKNKRSDIRYQQNFQRGPAPRHAGDMATPARTPPSPYSQQYSPTHNSTTDLPSSNTDLARGREATWVPQQGAWSRRTTPASTPRATPVATPMQTPLATPRHSPPRDDGFIFPARQAPGQVSPVNVGALANDFPSLHIHSPGRGRGRGMFR